MKENNIKNLKGYVAQCEPRVNILLRNGLDASDLTFDQLFQIGFIPKPLYRAMNNKDFIITEEGIFTDKGYLSCTSDIDSFISHVTGDYLACLQFDIPDEFSRIDVHQTLPDYNDEKEFILPRGLKFQVVQKQKFSTHAEIQEFLDTVQSYTSARDILEHYNGVFLYKLKSA